MHLETIKLFWLFLFVELNLTISFQFLLFFQFVLFKFNQILLFAYTEEILGHVHIGLRDERFFLFFQIALGFPSFESVEYRLVLSFVLLEHAIETEHDFIEYNECNDEHLWQHVPNNR